MTTINNQDFNIKQISYFQRFNTDIDEAKMGLERLKKEDYNFEDVLNRAIEIRAHVIVLPSNQKIYYIKGIRGKNIHSFEEIKNQILHNIDKKPNAYKPKSTLWLINYSGHMLHITRMTAINNQDFNIEQISYLQKFNTDIDEAKMGVETYNKEDYNFKYVFNRATQLGAHAIVLPSNKKKWYIKGIRGKNILSFEEIKNQILHNIDKKPNAYKPKSTLWLINY